MSKTILPEDFQNKLSIVCILADKFNVKIKKLEFIDNDSWEIKCHEETGVMKIYFSENGVHVVCKYTNFNFLNLFDKNSCYALIIENKITDCYFREDTGIYHRMTNFDKINITYSDGDEVNTKTSSKKM